MSASYTHLTTEERESLLKMQTLGYGVRRMAQLLARSPSSISRELRRNVGHAGYSPSLACSLYQRRRRRCVRRKRLDDPVLKEYVTTALQKFWSPEQIDGRLKLERGRPVISYSTIYRAMDRGELAVAKACFRRKRHPPTPHAKETRGRISDYRHIEELPRAAVTGSQRGHWQGDTLRGGQGKGAMSTNVDRRSKFLVGGLMRDRKAQTLNAAMFAAFAGFPAHLLKSFLFDHGNEFFSYKEIEEVLGTKVYFADPYSPWQRGLNENTNGLLRQYFPKGFNFNTLDPAEFDKVILSLNTRPRKLLGYRTPLEVFRGVVLHLG